MLDGAQAVRHPGTGSTDVSSPGLEPGLPRLPRRLLGRPELERRLDRLAPVTLVTDLPGTGRTTLVAAWARRLRAEGASVLWLRGRPELDDPERLGSLLDPARMPASSGDGRYRGIAVVVIDDADPIGRDAAELLVDRVAHSEVLHLVATGLHCRHLRAAARRRQLETNASIRHALGVTPEELADLARVWGYAPPSERVAELAALTGGWIEPVRILLEAAPRASDGLPVHAVLDHVESVVLPQVLTPELREVATFAALVDPLEPAVVATLVKDGAGLRTDDPVAAVAELERRGVLQRDPSTTDTGRWRMPPLLRRALLERLRHADHDLVRDLHRRAGRVVGRAGDLDAVVRALPLARRGEDWPRLQQWWDAQAWRLVTAAPVEFVQAYGGLPVAVLEQEPVLRVPGGLADALAESSRLGDPDQRLEALMRHYASLGPRLMRRLHEMPNLMQRVDVLTASLVALRRDGRIREAARLVHEVQPALTRAQHAARPPSSVQVAWCETQMGLSLLLAGDVPLGIVRLQAAQDRGSTGLIRYVGLALLALANSIHGSTRDAQYLLDLYERGEGAERPTEWRRFESQLPIRITRLMLALDRLDADEAAEHVRHLRHGLEESELWPFSLLACTRYDLLFGDPASALIPVEQVAVARAKHLEAGGLGAMVHQRCLVELLLALGEVNHAQRLLGDEANVPPWLRTPLARLHLMTGRPRQAQQVASAASWSRGGDPKDRAHQIVLSAVARRRTGDRKGALRDLARARTVWRHVGDLEPFLLVPEEDRDELLVEAGPALGREARERMRGIAARAPEHAELIALTSRETVVLQAMSTHATAAAVAEELGVSVNTVKKQMVSIYAKLNVHDRSAALLRARSLGLLATD